MPKWKAYVCLVSVPAAIITSGYYIPLSAGFYAACVLLIWLHRCPECKRKMIWAHPESEKVCRSCAIAEALTGKNRGNWNST